MRTVNKKIIEHEYLPSYLFKKYNKNKTYKLHLYNYIHSLQVLLNLS
jgi:hypothetical protein